MLNLPFPVPVLMLLIGGLFILPLLLSAARRRAISGAAVVSTVLAITAFCAASALHVASLYSDNAEEDPRLLELEVRLARATSLAEENTEAVRAMATRDAKFDETVAGLDASFSTLSQEQARVFSELDALHKRSARNATDTASLRRSVRESMMQQPEQSDLQLSARLKSLEVDQKALRDQIGVLRTEGSNLSARIVALSSADRGLEERRIRRLEEMAGREQGKHDPQRSAPEPTRKVTGSSSPAAGSIPGID